MNGKRVGKTGQMAFALLTAAALGACASPAQEIGNRQGMEPAREQLALLEVKQKQAKGQRVWCVPFARTASGINLRGDAKTWWNKAEGQYGRGNAPEVGSVMAFRATRGMPLGHVAMVSELVSPRKIKVDHANWSRNEVSLRMAVIDVSAKNDWSAVRVESHPASFGRVYPVTGFIYPQQHK
ncbi:chap [Haematobacter missouriensis]|nr:chap [Haematobacter missouriensis]